MRISDWSSDVCSSDLLDRVQRRLRRRNGVPGRPAGRAGRLRGVFQPADRAKPGTPYLPRDLAAFLRTGPALDGEPLRVQPVLAAPRSEEHTSPPVTNAHIVCRLLLEKKKHNHT